jgi:hypothetical protein
MALAIGGHAVANNTFTTSTTTSGVTTQASGSTFVVFVQTNRAGDPLHITSVTDSKSNTYTLVTSDNPGYGGDINLSAYVCVNGTGGASHTVTANYDEQATNNVFFIEITGADTTSPADGAAATVGGGTAGTSWPAPTVTTTNAADIIISCAGSYGFNTGIVTISANTAAGYAVIDSILAGTVSRHAVTSYLVVSSVGSYGDTYTTSATDGYSAITLAFKAGGAPPPPPTIGWQPIRPMYPPGASPGKFGRFYQSPKAYSVLANVTVGLTGQSATFAAGSLGPN